MTVSREIECDRIGNVWKGLAGEESTRPYEDCDEEGQDVEQSAHPKAPVNDSADTEWTLLHPASVIHAYCQLAAKTVCTASGC